MLNAQLQKQNVLQTFNHNPYFNLILKRTSTYQMQLLPQQDPTCQRQSRGHMSAVVRIRGEQFQYPSFLQ